MKTKTAVALALLTLILAVGYASAYVACVESGWTVQAVGYSWPWNHQQRPILWHDESFATKFFGPIHSLDRKIRRHVRNY